MEIYFSRDTRILDAASIEVRKAYKEFIGVVIELIDGEMPTEEFQEVALSCYRYFASLDEDELNRCAAAKK